MTEFKRGMGKKSMRWLCVLATVLILSLSFCACSWQSSISVDSQKLDFLSMSVEELSKYVEIGAYKNLEISISGTSKGDAVWDAVAADSKVKQYPEKHVYYYIEQLESQYRYYAEQAGISYKAMLEELGLNEGSITKEAKEMTEKDILYALVVNIENIELTESEKTSYFDRYVKKYASQHEYTEEYVRTNMTELIYDSMLYDKATEFLIVNNSFKK